jgi:hypothetical protein
VGNASSGDAEEALNFCFFAQLNALLISPSHRSAWGSCGGVGNFRCFFSLFGGGASGESSRFLAKIIEKKGKDKKR